MGLRAKVLQGGIYLAIRQGIGMVISLVGVLLITRVIGPKQYGLYASAFGLFYFLQNISQLGLTVFLVRKEREEGKDDRHAYDQAFTLLLLIGFTGIGLSKLGLPFLAAWIKLEGFEPIFQVLAFSLPIVLIGQVPMAQLERDLDYKRVAWVELMGQLGYFVTALTIAFNGGGAWSLVSGWWTQQVIQAGLFFVVSKYRPRLVWRPEVVKQMLVYSVGYSASFWVWQMRSLVNPLLVGRFLGAEAVAYVALAGRMVELLGFVKSATYRLSISTLAQLQGDRSRLSKAITDGMGLQILALGPFLVIVGWVGPWLLPLAFGSKWLPAMDVYPFIAVSLLANALFNMHSSALYALNRNWQITWYHVIHIVLFFGTAWVLIPKLGLLGFGLAEIATIASYIAIHFYLVQDLESPDYRFAALLAMALGLALFPHQLGWWVVLGIPIVLSLPLIRHKLTDQWKIIRTSQTT